MKRFTVFSIDCGSGDTKNFKCKCSGLLCCVCGLISVRSWGILWFLICGLVQVLLLSLVVNFSISNSHFPVTTLGLDLFSGEYLNKLLFLWCTVIITLS